MWLVQDRKSGRCFSELTLGIKVTQGFTAAHSLMRKAHLGAYTRGTYLDLALDQAVLAVKQASCYVKGLLPQRPSSRNQSISGSPRSKENSFLSVLRGYSDSVTDYSSRERVFAYAKGLSCYTCLPWLLGLPFLGLQIL